MTVNNVNGLGYWDNFANTPSANSNSLWRFNGGTLDVSLSNGLNAPQRRPLNLTSGNLFVNGTTLKASSPTNSGVAIYDIPPPYDEPRGLQRSLFFTQLAHNRHTTWLTSGQRRQRLVAGTDESQIWEP